MGRVTILTEEIQDRMCEAILLGNYAPTAAEYAGIGVSTHYQWLEKGKQGISPYAEYAEAIKKAEAGAEVRNVALIQEAAKKNWTAAAWYLERKHYDKWGRRERSQIELTGKDGAPIEMTQVDSRAALMAMLGHEIKEAPLSLEQDNEITEDGPESI